MSARFPRPHRWYRQRVAALRAGLLEPAEAQLLREHLEACGDCREAHAVMGAGISELQADDDHIPLELLARWERVRTALPGLERAMVRAHLARCAECRQDLELLGYVPELEAVPELEPEAGALAAPAEMDVVLEPEAPARETGSDIAAPRRARARGMDAAGRPLGARPWMQWVLGGWATAATAAVALLIAVRPQPAVDESIPPPGESATSPGPPSPIAEPGRADKPGPPPPSLEAAAVIVLGQDLRGTPATDTLPLNVVHPDARAIVIGVSTEAMFDVPPETEVRVELFDPSGRPAASADFTMERLLTERALVLRPGEGRIQSGVYRLRLTAPARDPVVTRFKVQVRRR